MRRIGFLVAALGAMGSVSAIAANDAVVRGPAPAWIEPSELLPVPVDAAGLAFMRGQDFLIHLDDKGQSSYLGYRVKILHPNALAFGNLSIVWNPATGAPIVHALKIHRGATVIDVLDESSFEILRREDQLEMATLDGLLTAALKVPDLRVGDELELAFTTRSGDVTLGPDSFGIMAVAPEPLPGRFHMGLSWDARQEPTIKIASDLAPIVQRGTNGISFALDDPAPLALPKDAPMRFMWQRLIEYSDFPDWQAVSRRFAPLFAEAARLKPASSLKQEAATIAAAEPNQFGRAAAALKLVQQEVRYVYLSLDGGNFTPSTAEQTWQRRYGDCKGKTALLLALLNELGIKAEPVLVSNAGTDDGLDQRLPSPAMFDHVLVRATIDGKTYWLDGTMPPVATPDANPILPYRWVLPLTVAGNGLEQQSWQPHDRPESVSIFDIDTTAGFAAPAKVSSTTIHRGIEGLQQQVQFSGLSRSQMLAAFRREMVGESWDSVDDVEWRYDAANRASILKITGTWTVDWDDDGDEARSLTLPGGGFSPPERRLRPADQDQKLPYYAKPEFECNVTTVRLPTATKVERWSYNSTFDTEIFGRQYHRAFEKRDGAIRMVRSSRITDPEISADQASKDNARIADFDNSMADIRYRPKSNAPFTGSGDTVPAADEIDWAADGTYCLPGDADEG